MYTSVDAVAAAVVVVVAVVVDVVAAPYRKRIVLDLIRRRSAHAELSPVHGQEQ